MINSQTLGVAVLGLLLSGAAMQGQTAARYREFQLGGSLASVSALTGVAASEAKTLHTRPAVLQELAWRRPYVVKSAAVADPVQQIAFSFYNDQLFRLVIDYDRDRTEGMTDTDMVDAISTIYGATLKPSSKPTGGSPVTDEESGTRVAGWDDRDYTAVLYRSSYASAFRMVVTSVRLNALARTAQAQALRLDERDAPQRERARQQKEADDARTAKEKARVANKAVFKP